MNLSITEEEKFRHPFYKIMNLSGDKLQSELQFWSREKLIDWLSWNDRNGVYRDEDSMREFNNIISKEEAIEIITRQISES